jgi:signal transduction histidine kinase
MGPIVSAFASASPAGFLPHGYCIAWEPSLLALHVASDALITLAYYSIPLTLLYFLSRRPLAGYNWVLGLFAGFILACGTTHLLAIVTLWEPVYWIDGWIKAATAGVSLLTAALIWPLVPKVLALPTPSQLQVANAQLLTQIDERRLAEEELRHTNHALEAVNGELEAFAYSVSHDLRQPLRGMTGFGQILLEDYADKLDAQGKDYVQRIGAAAQRMGSLIDDLLALSRVTRGELHRERLDLSALAEAILADLRQVQPERDVEACIQPGLEVEGDPRLLRVMLENLLSNAWKFTGKTAGARIEMGRSEDGGDRIYFVQDNGAGFDMAHADKLFGAFQRLHGVDEFPGTGVGLASVQRIVHRHGGRIWAQSEPGRGATFSFTLA